MIDCPMFSFSSPSPSSPASSWPDCRTSYYGLWTVRNRTLLPSSALRPDHHDHSPPSLRERSRRSPRKDRRDHDPDDRSRTNAQELKQTLHSWAKTAKSQISESKIGLKILNLNNTLPRPFLGQACVFYNATSCELNRNGCSRRGKFYHHLCYLCHELLRVPSQHPAKNCPLK